MTTASSIITGNIAKVSLPTGTEITVKARTNSTRTQNITITSKSNLLNLAFTGSGERNTVLGQSSFKADSIIEVKFEYMNGSVAATSRLNTGGPYEIGKYNVFILVAENGDDSDYNDSIVELSWYTPMISRFTQY